MCEPTWISVAEELPPMKQGDIAGLLQSEPVLVLDRWKDKYTARLEVFDDEDASEASWVQHGRDGYRCEGLTHWRPLPDGPEPATFSEAYQGENGEWLFDVTFPSGRVGVSRGLRCAESAERARKDVAERPDRLPGLKLTFKG